MARPNLYRDLADLSAGYDLVIIDGAPRGNDLARSAILASDHVLIPVQPAPFDIWAARQTVELIEAAQEFKPEIAASFVISRSITNTAIARDAAKAFAGQAFPVAPGAITQRVVFPEFASVGLTVPEVDPKGPSTLELRALARYAITIKDRKAA